MTTFKQIKRTEEVCEALSKAIEPRIEEFVETVGSYPTVCYVTKDTMAYINTGIGRSRIHPYDREDFSEIVYRADCGNITIQISKKNPDDVGYIALSNNGDEEQLLKAACENMLLRD